MEAKSVLVKFREQRKLLENLRESMATPRLKGMWNFLYRQTETQVIIFRIPPVDRIVAEANPGKPVEAETYEEVVGIGLYIMKQCSETKKHITEIIHDLGIGRRDPKSTRQSYVDDAMSGYINPALDFIDRELEELEKTKEKPTAPRRRRVKDIRLSDKTADELTIEEASIAAYSIPDQPARYDALGFEPYTTAISEFLSHEDTKPPLTLSVEGEWGSGKSSFMLQLIEKLAKDGLVVQFSPWRHDKEDEVWAAFVLAFSKQLSKKLGWFKSILANIKLEWRRFDWRAGWPEVLRVTAKWCAFLLVVISIILVLWMGGLPYVENKAVKMLLSFTGVLVVVWKALKKAKDFIGNPFEHDLRTYVQAPDYTRRIPFIERFHEDFKKIVETYAAGKKVYVFIDDLDRCQIPKASDLMQAINLMISDDPQLIFVVGMDRKKVAAGLAVKHEKLLPYLTIKQNDSKYSSGLEYGYSFIEKFIQLPFNIPRPTESDIENLMDKISETHQVERVESPSGKQIDGAAETVGVKQNIEEDLEEEKVREQRRETLRLKLAGDSPKIREIVLMVAPVFDYNPRRVKQFINLFRLRVYIASETGLFDILESETKFNRLTLEQLGKFVAISMNWPSLISDLDKEPDLLKGLSGASGGDIGKESRYVKQWFENKRLMSLVDFVPKDKGDEKESLEWTKYNLLYMDVKKLLEISPKVSRIEIPPEQETYTTQEKYKAFYSELLDRIKEKHPEIKRKKALPQNWLSLPIGHGGIHLEWGFHGRPRSWFEVGLHFEKSSLEKNRQLHDHFLDIKSELERDLGGLELTFECPWGTRWARIYVRKDEWEMSKELGDWAVKTALKFYDVFKPRLDKFIRSKTDKWGAIDKGKEITNIERVSQIEQLRHNSLAAYLMTRFNLSLEAFHASLTNATSINDFAKKLGDMTGQDNVTEEVVAVFKRYSSKKDDLNEIRKNFGLWELE